MPITISTSMVRSCAGAFERRRKAGTIRLRACAATREVPVRDPLNRERRSTPLRLYDTPIKGTPAQFPASIRAWFAQRRSRWN